MKKAYCKFLVYIPVVLGIMVTRNIFATFPEFEFHIIGDTDEDLLSQTSLADIDQDGDLDFVVGSSVGTIWWFQYEGADKWTKQILGDNGFTYMGGTTVDVDGDGFPDQVSGQTWFRNPGNPITAPFERFENGAIIAYDNVAGDVNGDGILDIVALSEHDGLYWYDFSKKPEKKWKSTQIGDGVPGGIAPNGIADIDRDGDNDIVRSNAWYENESGDGKKWIPHRVIEFGENTGKFVHSLRVWVVDMDNDGDNDIVATEMNTDNSRIAWFENKDKLAINWFTHTIDYDTKQDYHSLAVFDFDNDGDYDVFTGGGKFTSDFHKRCFIYENANGKGEEWNRHEILVDHECHDAVAGDVDGDGDIDICSKPWNGTTCYFLNNQLIENKGK